MRSRELVTESGILSATEDFLFIPLVSRDSDQLQPPLKKHMVIVDLNIRPSPLASVLANVSAG